jgi:predicted ribosome quality control (RQC) complex YloA/Tae2 family protein
VHNNYYFLRQLSKALEQRLKNCVVSECFSQSKEELLIRFETFDEPFFIRASLLSVFSCLSFPENFQRARKNSIDLFEPIIGQRLINLQQFENERSFAIHFTNKFSLLFKMHGNRSNCVLFENNEVINLFKNSIEQDAAIVLSNLNREIDWGFDAFKKNKDKLQQTYFTFGKLVWQYLEQQGFDQKNEKEKWTQVLAIHELLTNPDYSITKINDEVVFSLIKTGEIVKTFSDPIKAITEFYYKYTQSFTVEKEKNDAISQLKCKLQSSKAYIEKTFKKYKEVTEDNHYKIWADIVMANLHSITARAEIISLENFYNENKPIEIKLKKDLSPQKNAEVFYRKAKNQQIEIDRLQQVLAAKEKEVIGLNEMITNIQATTDLKVLRNKISEAGLNVEKEKQEESLPYHINAFKGYTIWVGKNAKANDLLTLKYAFKEDLWLHAKDVAGSHVIIKYQSGKKFPKDVVERAAQLAAYYSKRKNDTLCPVAVTPKKFVRKRKGDAPGAVVVEREEVILVEPKN